MDPELAAAYREGYARATIRDFASTALSTAAKASRTHASQTGIATATAEKAAQLADKTLAQFLAKLLHAVLLFLTHPVRHLWSDALSPLLATIWLHLQHLLTFLLYLTLAFALLILCVNGQRYGHWVRYQIERLRARYDDFAVNNRFTLDAEHAVAGFRRAVYDRWLRLRYNETGDAIARFWWEVYFLPDRLARLVGRNWVKIVLCGALAGWIWFARSVNGVVDHHHPPQERRMPHPNMQIPAWVFATSKSVGSNSHYTPEPEAHAPVPYEKWVAASSDAAVGSMRSARPKPKIETMTMTVTVWETSGIRLSEAPEKMADYWAPPSGGRTVLGKDEMRWCRQCQQFHCCELPY